MPLGMPSYTDYDSMLGMNPWAQMQANEQLGLANQFQQQDLQKGNLANEKASLDNLFTAQDNPNRVQERVLTNQGLDIGNQDKGIDLNRKKANQQNILNADQRKAALDATDDHIKEMDNHVGVMLRSQDPAEREEGLKLQQFMPQILAERRKQADAMEMEKYKQLQQTGRATELQQSNERIAGVRAGATLGAAQVRGAGKTNSPESIAAKLGYEKGAAYYLIKAEEADTPEDEAKYRDLASKFEQLNMNAKNAGAGQGIAPTVQDGKVVLSPKQAPASVISGGASPTSKPQEHSLSKVQEMYPGIPAAKLKELYKKKFGVDLQ